jgi:hypothetical protein
VLDHCFEGSFCIDEILSLLCSSALKGLAQSHEDFSFFPCGTSEEAIFLTDSGKIVPLM